MTAVSINVKVWSIVWKQVQHDLFFFSKPELFQYFSQDLEMFIKKLAKEKRKF